VRAISKGCCTRAIPGRSSEVKAIRIGLTGAHGTGKSTIARGVAADLALPLLPSPGRLLAEQELPLNYEATVESETVAWLTQLRLETQTAEWVSQRTLLDVWAYASLAAERHPTTPVGRALLAELSVLTRELLLRGQYQILFYLPPRIPLRADALRLDDHGFQTAVDDRIRGALEDHGTSYVELDASEHDVLRHALERIALRQD
jgi:hypothetical protein